ELYQTEIVPGVGHSAIHGSERNAGRIVAQELDFDERHPSFNQNCRIEARRIPAAPKARPNRQWNRGALDHSRAAQPTFEKEGRQADFVTADDMPLVTIGEHAAPERVERRRAKSRCPEHQEVALDVRSDLVVVRYAPEVAWDLVHPTKDLSEGNQRAK